MQSDKEDQQHDANQQVRVTEATGMTSPLTQQDALAPQPEDLGPQSDDPEDLGPQPEDLGPQSDDPEDLGPQPEDLGPQYDDADLSMAVLTPHPSIPNTSEDLMNVELLQEDEEEEEELFILDPEHLLVKRLQDALNIQLKKNLERLKQELHEKRAVKKADDIHSEKSALDLFRVQEQLARKQSKMDALHQTRAQEEVKRRQTQDQLEVAKSRYSEINQQSCQDEARVSKLQAELDKLSQHLSLTEGVSEDLHSKVKIMKNIKYRAEVEKIRAEDQILKQDLYVERLTKELERLTVQVAVYESQTSAQAEETRAAKEALSEAEMEMESLLMVHKQLLQQWNSSLMDIRKKSEVLCAMQEAVRAVMDQVITLNREIEGYKKVTAAEQEKNETLTGRLNWCETDCATSKKLISQKQAEQEALKAQYSICLRSLHETERTIATLTKEEDVCQTDLNHQRKLFEKECSVRLELEDKIMSQIQQHLTHKKAAKYSRQLTSGMNSLKKDKMNQLQQMENDLFSVKLESQKISQEINRLTLTQEALDEEITKYNKLLTSYETKFSATAQTIEKKQGIISNLKSKISIIVANTGHEDLSPLQIKVYAITSQIEELAANIKNDQQLWLLQLEELVGLTKDLDANSWMMHKLQKEHNAMQQKRIRLERQIEQEERETGELEKNLKILKRDVEKLCDLLSRNEQLSQALELENMLMETDFVHKLKEAEWESINIQMKAEKMQEENEMLQKSHEEADQQIMLWERRIQILKETRSTLESEIYQDEIQKIKAEIHRMELRISQLNKQQEHLMRESEAVVAKREHVLLRKEALTRSSPRDLTAAELKRSIEGLKRGIQRAHKEVADCTQVVWGLERNKESLSEKILQQKQEVTELTRTSQNLDSEFETLQDNKDTKQVHLTALQHRSKKLREVCEGSYRLSSSSDTVGAALQSQQERLDAVGSMLQDVCVEFPQHQGALHKVSRAVNAYRQISLL